MHSPRAWPGEDASVLTSAWVGEMTALLEGDGEDALCGLLTRRGWFSVRTERSVYGSTHELHAPRCSCPGGAELQERAWGSVLELAATGVQKRGLGVCDEVRPGACVGGAAIEEWQRAHCERWGVSPDVAAVQCAELVARWGVLSPWGVEIARADTSGSHPRVRAVRDAFCGELRQRLRGIPSAGIGSVLQRIRGLGGGDADAMSDAEAASYVAEWMRILERAGAVCEGEVVGSSQGSSAGGEVLVVMHPYRCGENSEASVLRLWMEEMCAVEGEEGVLVVGAICEHAWDQIQRAGVEDVAVGVRVGPGYAGCLEGEVLQCFARLASEAGVCDEETAREILHAAADALAVI